MPHKPLPLLPMTNSLFLARALVPYEVAVKRGMTDPYTWHQRAWDAFPDRDKQKRNFLTRLEEKNEHLQCLILAHSEPSKPDWCPSDGWTVKAVPDTFFDHAEFDFSLLANPTRKLVNRDPLTGRRIGGGKRIAITNRDDEPDKKDPSKNRPGLLTWLKRHGEDNGFTFDPEDVATNPAPFRRFLKGTHKVTLHAVDFRGRLRVTDPVKFRAIFYGREDESLPGHLVLGLGSAKGFGFGMLMVVPR